MDAEGEEKSLYEPMVTHFADIYISSWASVR